MEHREGTLTLSDLARRVAPHLDVVSTSNPEPTLKRHNIIGITPDEDTARQAVLSFESDDQTPSDVGTVVMGSTAVDEGASGIDPEGVTGYAAKRSVLGGAIAAVVGAAIFGGVVAIVWGNAGFALGAALGGALLFAPFGAIWLTFAGISGSSAFRQSFVDPDVADVILVTLHTDDVIRAMIAKQRLGDEFQMRVVTVDAEGREVF